MAIGKNRILNSLVSGIFLLIMAGAFIACDSGRVFEDYRNIDNSSWHQDSLLTFDVKINDLSASHNILFNVRNKGTYKFNNLWLFITLHQPDGSVVIDSMEVTLADPVTGKWYGKGLGSLYDKQYPYKEGVAFPDTGNYVFDIQHGMRTNDGFLKGINDFGLRIEKTD